MLFYQDNNDRFLSYKSRLVLNEWFEEIKRLMNKLNAPITSAPLKAAALEEKYGTSQKAKA